MEGTGLDYKTLNQIYNDLKIQLFYLKEHNLSQTITKEGIYKIKGRYVVLDNTNIIDYSPENTEQKQLCKFIGELTDTSSVFSTSSSNNIIENTKINKECNV